ncbi:TetR/AcrR family transcriptional regulator [Noviherbaspirillum aridicola]|uniref:TetR family transcriptional regulator n=1 Tax=Noviherbaspirillum aridicola TaxID=2849687 RepID=A0ABQ4Q8H2_9BURK|nr:TetR/AcrR family transcriptional regulator [Noviherbaspirillum aridicola]GIZ53364.1 TetR family transcriptional regulator [Noviherbaspirillum aridicola]
MARTPTTRSYRGVTQDERRRQRRASLIAAAIAVYGERGFRNASVKAVCEAAGLTERYFYESFANSEALLVAAFNAVTYAVHRESVEAAQGIRGRRERARAMIGAYFSALKREPHSARVFLVEIRGVSRAVDEAFELALRSIARSNGELLGLTGPGADEMLQVAVLGGVLQLASSWVNQGYRPSIETVTDTAIRLTNVLFSRN